MEDANLVEFLSAMTDLSHKHKIAIGGEPILWVLECWEDGAREYQCDGDSKLTF